MNPRTELLIRIINLIIIFGLVVFIYLNGINLTCNKCEIQLTSERLFADTPKELRTTSVNVSMIDLFESVVNDSCVLKWDKQSGWIYYGRFNYG